MTFPNIKDPVLESCLGKNVIVEYLEPMGILCYFGTLQEFSKPWHLNLMFEYNTDDSITAAHAVAKKSTFSFAGEDGAIIRITCRGKVVYENSNLPSKYPKLNCNLEEGLSLLNELRRRIWGDFFLFR